MSSERDWWNENWKKWGPKSKKNSNIYCPPHAKINRLTRTDGNIDSDNIWNSEKYRFVFFYRFKKNRFVESIFFSFLTVLSIFIDSSNRYYRFFLSICFFYRFCFLSIRRIDISVCSCQSGKKLIKGKKIVLATILIFSYDL